MSKKTLYLILTHKQLFQPLSTTMKPTLLILLILLFSSLTLKAQTETVVQFGHIGYAITEMELSPDGKFLATTDGQILKIWEMESGLEYRIVRPCGYFSDMGVLYDMASRGRSYLVGQGNNRMNPIHGRDLAEACVDAAEDEELEIEVGGPDIMTQREAAELAFEVVGKPARISVIPMWLARTLVRFIRLLSTQFGDLAEFIVTAGELDGVGPRRGTTTLRSYFESLHAADKKQE